MSVRSCGEHLGSGNQHLLRSRRAQVLQAFKPLPGLEGQQEIERFQQVVTTLSEVRQQYSTQALSQDSRHLRVLLMQEHYAMAHDPPRPPEWQEMLEHAGAPRDERGQVLSELARGRRCSALRAQRSQQTAMSKTLHPCWTP